MIKCTTALHRKEVLPDPALPAPQRVSPPELDGPDDFSDAAVSAPAHAVPLLLPYHLIKNPPGPDGHSGKVRERAPAAPLADGAFRQAPRRHGVQAGISRLISAYAFSARLATLVLCAARETSRATAG